jgi:hypothetical protein
MQKDNQHLIKSKTSLTQQDENFLREKFINDYSKNKGWDKNNLTPSQMFEIVQQSGYKNPGMILS